MKDLSDIHMAAALSSPVASYMFTHSCGHPSAPASQYGEVVVDDVGHVEHEAGGDVHHDEDLHQHVATCPTSDRSELTAGSPSEVRG